MGGKNNSAKRKGKKSGKPQQRQARATEAAGNDYRGADFTRSQVLGHGTMNTYLQQYAPVPTALDALPPPPVGFTGREDDLAYILGVLDPDRTGEGPAVAVLSGWGGVGKTTLAYATGHAAQKQGWFAGVLLVDLHGYAPPACAGRRGTGSTPAVARRAARAPPAARRGTGSAVPVPAQSAAGEG